MALQNNIRIREKGTNVLGNYWIYGLQPDEWTCCTHGKLYIFGKGEAFLFPKIYSFVCLLFSHSSGCYQALPYFRKISQYVSTLFPNTESDMQGVFKAYVISLGPSRRGAFLRFVQVSFSP